MTTETEPLLSFHSSFALKQRVLQRTRDYLARCAANELIGSVTGEPYYALHYLWNGKKKHKGLLYKFYETDYGIPQELAYIQEYVFQGHRQDENHARNPLQFWEAIPVGVSLDGVFKELMLWMLKDSKHGIQQMVPAGSKVSQMIDDVYEIYEAQQISIDSQQVWLRAEALAKACQLDARADLFARAEADVIWVVNYLAEQVGRGGHWAARASRDAVEAWVRAWYNHQQAKEKLGLEAPDPAFINRKVEALATELLSLLRSKRPQKNLQEIKGVPIAIRPSAFYGDKELKEQVKQLVQYYVEREVKWRKESRERHQLPIDMIRFLYQVNPRYYGPHYDFYERNYGIPEVLAHVEEEIFSPYVSLANVESVLQFWEAIPVGADLTNVFSQLGAWMLLDPMHGMQQFLEPGSEIAKLSLEVAELCQKQSTEVEMWRDKWKRLESLLSFATFVDDSASGKKEINIAAWVVYHIAAVQGHGDEWGPKEGGGAVACWKAVWSYWAQERTKELDDVTKKHMNERTCQILAETLLKLLRMAPVS